MGEVNTVPTKVDASEGQAGQLKKSGGPGVAEAWDPPNRTYVWFIKGDVATGTELRP